MRSSAEYRLLSKLLTFQSTTTLQRCKLINAFGGGLGRLRQQAAYAIPISSRTMSFPADSTGGNLRQSSLPETRQIIALPIPESNRKSENSNSALRALPTSRGTSRTGKTRGTMNSGIHYGFSHLNQ